MIFHFLEQPSAGIRLSSVKNCVFFASFGVPGAPLSGKTRVECQTEGFLRFWCARKCPEDCADDSFCFIRSFFRERKNERKSPKNVKNWGFW